MVRAAGIEKTIDIVVLALCGLPVVAPEFFMGSAHQGPVMSEQDAMKSLDSLSIGNNPAGSIGMPVIDLTLPGGNC